MVNLLSSHSYPNPELRTMNFMQLMAGDEYKKYELLLQKERERFYVVTSFACNSKCQYCLFRFDAKRIRPCDNKVFAAKIKSILNTYPDTNFSISITGGEPLLDEKRTIAILDAIASVEKKSIRWIGFGTNGSSVPVYLENYPDFHFDLYISRHHYSHDRNVEIFQNKRIRQLSDYSHLSSNVSIKLSCNLIRGDIDSVEQVKLYLQWAEKNGIHDVTFRELNKIAGTSTMYDQKYILDYIDYYGKMIIRLSDILSNLDSDETFQFIGQDIRPFIYHEYWKYRDIIIKFRRVDEAQLLNYNSSYDGIDEVVLHPDGLVTGCWDREQKKLNF